MAIVINMPRLSDTMTEGVVAKWHKSVGDKVSEGDLLAEIETDKATMEFEAFPGQEGILLYIGTGEGEMSPVDTVLAILGEEGEDIESLKGGSVPTEEPVKEEAPAPTPVEEAPAPAASSCYSSSGSTNCCSIRRKCKGFSSSKKVSIRARY